MIKAKKITISTAGPILPKGGIQGPIRSPYLENIDVIASLIMGGYSVNEVLRDGTELPLNLTNFDRDNDVPVDKPTPVPVVTEPSIRPIGFAVEKEEEPAVEVFKPENNHGKKKNKLKPDTLQSK